MALTEFSIVTWQMAVVGKRRAIADEYQADAILAAHLEGQSHAGHYGNHVAQRRDLADEPPLGIAEMDVELAPARRRIPFRHVLP